MIVESNWRAGGMGDWRDLLTFGLGCALLALMLLSLCLGDYPISLTHAARITARLAWPWPMPDSLPWSAEDQIVVQSIRMPRVLLATLSGAGLGISGAALQGVMRNPLVGPDLVGVTSGASLGGVVALILGLPSFGVVALAFGGGTLAVAAATLLARAAGGRGAVLALILSGVVVASFCSACMSFLLYVADPFYKLPRLIFWLLGSFAGATSKQVPILAIPTIVVGAIVIAARWRLNLLSLGETDARALGIPVEALRWTTIALVSLIVAAQISVSGGVGWVGLAIPHFTRMIVGPNHSRLLPASAMLGGIFLLAVDDIARTIVPREVPIGVLTAMVGVPVFATLLWRTQARGWAGE